MRYPVRQSFTLAAANLIGHAENVTGASWPITTGTAGDGLAHHVTIRNDTANDHAAKTITLTGLDANGNTLTETLSAPGVSATVTSTKAFKVLSTAVPSATIGADTFDIGWAATGHSPWVDLNPRMVPFSASVAVYLVSGSCNFDAQHTYEDPPTEDSIVFAQTALAGKTATTDGSFVAPVTGVRLDINSHTSGVLTFVVLQGERTY